LDVKVFEKEKKMNNTKYIILEERIEKYIVEKFVPNFMNCNFRKNKYIFGEQMNSLAFWFNENKGVLTFNYSERANKVKISAFLMDSLDRNRIFEVKQNEDIEKILLEISLMMKKERLKNLYKGE
jgi:hypothetical protein